MNRRKVAVIGCGNVGATCAFELIESGLFLEMVLIDVDQQRSEGEAMDLSHGSAYSHAMKIYSGNYDDIQDAGVIVITAGAAQRDGETRLDLVRKNVKIMKSIIEELKNRKCEGILLIVSNPVDILTYVALKISGFEAHRVIGSGTVLDTARLRYVIGERLMVDSRNVHAYIVGEHGDSEVPIFSTASISGIHMNHFAQLRGYFNYEDMILEVYEDVKNSAYEIIKRKGATYYGIAVAVKRICEAIIKDEHSILPVSSLMEGAFGFHDLCLSVPTVIGKDGVEMLVDIYLNNDEYSKLEYSAKTLKSVIDDLNEEGLLL